MLLNNCKINLWETCAKIPQKEEIPPNEWGHERWTEQTSARRSTTSRNVMLNGPLMFSQTSGIFIRANRCEITQNSTYQVFNFGNHGSCCVAVTRRWTTYGPQWKCAAMRRPAATFTQLQKSYSIVLQPTAEVVDFVSKIRAHIVSRAHY